MCARCVRSIKKDLRAPTLCGAYVNVEAPKRPHKHKDAVFGGPNFQPRFCGLKGHELFAEVEEEYAGAPKKVAG